MNDALVLKQSEMLNQIRKAGMEIVDEILFDASNVASRNDPLMDSLLVRCLELAEKYPEKKKVFLDYFNQQQPSAILKNRQPPKKPQYPAMKLMNSFGIGMVENLPGNFNLTSISRQV